MTKTKTEKFNRPTSSKHLIGVDPLTKKKEAKKETFQDLYRQAVAMKFADPSLTRTDIAKSLCIKLKLSSKSFSNMMDDAGWKLVEDKFRSSAGMINETPQLIKALEEKRKEKTVKHLDKMMEYLDDAHDTVDEVVQENKKDRKLAKKNLGGHLNNLKTLASLGKEVLGHDKEENQTPRTVINLAILSQYDPTK